MFCSFQSSFPCVLSLDPTDSVGRAGHFTDKEMKLRNLSPWTKDTGLRIGPGALHPGTRSFCDAALCSQGIPLHF